MRVCLYTETALPVVGGQELAIDALARQFQALGHDAVVLTLRARNGQSVDDSPLPYPVVRHRRYVSTRHLLGIYGAALSSVHRKYPFDVLHCHNVYPAGFVAALWAASRGVPLVITSHACDIAPDSHLLRKPGVPARVAQVLKQASAVVAISEMVEQQFRQLGWNDRPVARISSGVDVQLLGTPVQRPADLPDAIRPHQFFLFLGRLVHRKGADLLIDALHVAADTPKVHLVIAGGGEQLDELKSRVANLGLVKRVHFLGDVSGAWKHYLLQNAVCTVMPSRISEGFPLVLLESFAAGRPVIGTAIPGLLEAIRPGETGWLVPAESPAALAQTLAAAVADSESIEYMGRTARRAAGQFDWRAIAAQHVALYEHALSNPSHRRAA